MPSHELHQNGKERGNRRAPLTASDLRLGMKLYLKRASGVKLIQQLVDAGIIRGKEDTTGRGDNPSVNVVWEVIRVEPFEWSVVGFDPRPAYRVQFRAEAEISAGSGTGFGRVLRTEEYFINNEVGFTVM